MEVRTYFFFFCQFLLFSMSSQSNIRPIKQVWSFSPPEEALTEHYQSIPRHRSSSPVSLPDATMSGSSSSFIDDSAAPTSAPDAGSVASAVAAAAAAAAAVAAIAGPGSEDTTMTDLAEVGGGTFLHDEMDEEGDVSPPGPSEPV
jgi:hypothetical protein